MTSVFDFEQGRADPAAPVALTPLAAQNGGDDSGAGGLDLSFFLTLGASLGKLAESMQADRDRLDGFERPADRSLFASGAASAAGRATLDLGSVPLGRVWQVRRIIVGGIAVTTTAAGSAYAFAQGAPPADLNLTNCVDIFSTMPQGNTYGTHQLFLVPTEHLWLVIVGGTSAQQYTASARVEDWAEGDFATTFSE